MNGIKYDPCCQSHKEASERERRMRNVQAAGFDLYADGTIKKKKTEQKLPVKKSFFASIFGGGGG